MAQRWHFHMEGENIEVVCRVEGDGGLVGDARWTVIPDQNIPSPPGLTYEVLRAADRGVLEIGEGDSFRIIPGRGDDSYAGLTEGQAALMRRMRIDVSGPLFGKEVDGVVMGDCRRGMVGAHGTKA